MDRAARTRLDAPIAVAVETRRRAAIEIGTRRWIIAGYGSESVLECKKGLLRLRLLGHDVVHAGVVDQRLPLDYHLKHQPDDQDDGYFDHS